MNKRTTPTKCQPGTTDHLTDFESAKAGREIIVNEFMERIAIVWDMWPSAWRLSIVQAVDFTHSKKQAQGMALFKWHQFSEVEKNMIANGVVRIIQIRNFIAAALIGVIDQKIEESHEKAAERYRETGSGHDPYLG